VNQIETICESAQLTPRNVVRVGFASVWLGEPLNGSPRLYAAGNAALLCALRSAFPIRPLFSSTYQMRLWCDYHGFEFRDATWLPRPDDIHTAGPLLRIRPLSDFSVTRYAEHQLRCPDCLTAARKGWRQPAHRVGQGGVA